MEVLRFIITGKTLKKDLSTPFDKLVAGSGEQIITEYSMDNSWAGCSCIVRFITSGITRYVPIVNKRAEIPPEVLDYKHFSVTVVGQRGSKRILTNENQVIQIGGK